MRQNQDKPKLNNVLSMPGALEALAAVLQYGADKYTPVEERTWVTYDTNEVKDSLMRHLAAPGVFDEESGLPHIAHILFNAAVLCDHYLTFHGPGSFWHLLREDSDENSNPPLTEVSCDRRRGHPLSSPSLQPSSGDGPDSA